MRFARRSLSLLCTRRALAVCLLLALCRSASPAWADEAAERAQEVRVGILYNLAKFITWPAPEKPLAHFSLCTMTDAAFSELLGARVKDKTVGSLAIEVRNVAAAANVAGCQIVFVDAAHRSALASLRDVAVAQSILVVSEAETFDAEIGMINLVLADKHLQLEVEVTTLGAAKLTASSQLLKLAVLRH